MSWGFAAATCGVALALTGCAGGCAIYDLVPSGVGAPTAEAAVGAWLPNAPSGFDPDVAGWHPMNGDVYRFTDGSGLLELTKDERSRWFVVAASTCVRA